jgi:hypothetical protein
LYSVCMCAGLCACECEFVCVLCVYKCGSALYVSMCDSAGMCLSVCVCVCVCLCA